MVGQTFMSDHIRIDKKVCSTDSSLVGQVPWAPDTNIWVASKAYFSPYGESWVDGTRVALPSGVTDAYVLIL